MNEHKCYSVSWNLFKKCHLNFQINKINRKMCVHVGGGIFNKYLKIVSMEHAEADIHQHFSFFLVYFLPAGKPFFELY